MFLATETEQSRGKQAHDTRLAPAFRAAIAAAAQGAGPASADSRRRAARAAVSAALSAARSAECRVLSAAVHSRHQLTAAETSVSAQTAQIVAEPRSLSAR